MILLGNGHFVQKTRNVRRLNVRQGKVRFVGTSLSPPCNPFFNLSFGVVEDFKID
jgi:hypothetical protein